MPSRIPPSTSWNAATALPSSTTSAIAPSGSGVVRSLSPPTTSPTMTPTLNDSLSITSVPAVAAVATSVRRHLHFDCSPGVESGSRSGDSSSNEAASDLFLEQFYDDQNRISRDRWDFDFVSRQPRSSPTRYDWFPVGVCGTKRTWDLASQVTQSPSRAFQTIQSTSSSSLLERNFRHLRENDSVTRDDTLYTDVQTQTGSDVIYDDDDSGPPPMTFADFNNNDVSDGCAPLYSSKSYQQDVATTAAGTGDWSAVLPQWRPTADSCPSEDRVPRAASRSAHHRRRRQRQSRQRPVVVGNCGRLQRHLQQQPIDRFFSVMKKAVPSLSVGPVVAVRRRLLCKSTSSTSREVTRPAFTSRSSFCLASSVSLPSSSMSSSSSACNVIDGTTTGLPSPTPLQQ